jgi:hypothetical protein
VHVDARVVAELPIELAVTDVDRDDAAAPRCRGRREAAGGAPTSSAPAGGIDLEVVERMASFTPPRPT